MWMLSVITDGFEVLILRTECTKSETRDKKNNLWIQCQDCAHYPCEIMAESGGKTSSENLENAKTASHPDVIVTQRSVTFKALESSETDNNEEEMTEGSEGVGGLEEEVEEDFEEEETLEGEEESEYGEELDEEEQEKSERTVLSEDEELEQSMEIPHVDRSILDVSLIEPEEEVVEEEEIIEIEDYTFPVLEDPGIDAAFYKISEEKPVYDDSGQDCYLDICKALEVMPSSKFVQSLLTDRVNFRYYGLNPRSVRAIAESLYNNKTVTEVDLEGNWLTRDAAFHIGEMLKRSYTIRRLNLCGCRIGAEGAQRLCEGLSSTATLLELNLSWNDLHDEGMTELSVGLMANTSISQLNLSHNKLGNASGFALGTVMANNTSITELDVSWNELFPKAGLTAFLKTVIAPIERFNFSWNGLNNDAGKPLRIFLSKSNTLRYFDVSNNRLTGPPIRAIKTGLAKNKSVEILKIGNNPLSQEDTMAILGIVADPSSVVKEIDLENIWVDKEFLEVQESILEDKPDIKINICGVYSNYEIKGPDVKKLLLARATFEGLKPKKKKKKRHFGHFLLKLEEKPIGKKKFREEVLNEKIKLNENLVTQLMKNFQGRRKKVDVAAMKEYYMMLYPDTKLPEKKPKKKRGKKKKGGKSGTESGTTTETSTAAPSTEAPSTEAPSTAATSDTEGASTSATDTEGTEK